MVFNLTIPIPRFRIKRKYIITIKINMRTIKQIFKITKSSILIAIGIFAFNCAYAQGYYHGVGGQFEQGTFKLEAENFSETANPGVPGAFYKATYGFTEKFAVSAYPFLGFSGSTNSRTGASSDSSIGISLPVVAEMYFGDMDDACFFAGAGFAYSKLGSNRAMEAEKLLVHNLVLAVNLN